MWPYYLECWQIYHLLCMTKGPGPLTGISHQYRVYTSMIVLASSVLVSVERVLCRGALETDEITIKP